MVKIMFICLGNICRSPMAELVMKELVRRENLSSNFYISSSGTSSEEVGNGIHHGTIRKLKEMNIPIENRVAVKLKKEDYNKYDFLIGMEDYNIRNINRIIDNGDPQKKVCKLLDFSNNPRDIADPWYTGNFDETYEDILEGCTKLLEYCKKQI